MKLHQALKELTPQEAEVIAEKAAAKAGIDWNSGIKYVFSVIIKDIERAPKNIGGNKDTVETLIEKWVNKYKKGYEGRASKRVSNLPGTIADPIIEKIIGARLNNLDENDLLNITFAHRLSMSAENILGLILEEYLFNNLLASGWHCAWGETVKSVDFVHEDGSLLQIKNRSNSENSSSSAIRKGTEIQKWFRIKADRIEYMWEALNEICGTKHLSEEAFVEFAIQCLTENPDCLAVEDNNPWS